MTLVRVTGDQTPRIAGLGDLVRDVQGLYAIATAESQPGGLRAYLSNIEKDFDRLPSEVRVLRAQLLAVSNVLKASNSDDSPLANATRDLTQIAVQLPSVKEQLRQLVVELAPYLADIDSGIITTATVTQLAAHGADVAGTFNNVNALFTYRDDARAKIRQAITNPQLSPAVQQAAGDAYTQAIPLLGKINTPSALQLALIVAVGYVALDVFRGRGR